MNEKLRRVCELATLSAMTPHVIPFLKARIECVEIMTEKFGATEEEATDIIDKVCEDAYKTVMWAEKNVGRGVKSVKDKEDIMLKAMREVEGVTEAQMSDDEARAMIRQATKELKDCGLI